MSNRSIGLSEELHAYLVQVGVREPEELAQLRAETAPLPQAGMQIARRTWASAGVDDRIDLRLGPATETLETLLAEGGGGTFDLAFIDADKLNYDAYLEACLRLVRRGGLITIDNVLWSGRVADPSVDDADTVAIRALNAKLEVGERVDVAMLPVAD